MSTIEQLSKEFSRLVRRDLADHLGEIVARNRTVEYGETCCATHDFCDANMTMAEAFESVVGHGLDCGSDDDCALWNAAWGLSRSGEFSA